MIQMNTGVDRSYRKERAGAIAHEIKKRVIISREMKILDFGCGAGHLGLGLSDRCATMYFYDPSDQVTQELIENTDIGSLEHAVLIRDEHQLAALSGLDLVVSSLVLHHIDDFHKTIKQLSSLLKPGGFLCLADYDGDDGFFHKEDELHCHDGIDRECIINRMRELGFQGILSATVYMNKKRRNGSVRSYPIYLVSGKKSG